jgi:hypothetical protein
MKKLAVILAAAMIATVALPVAAANVDIGGKLDSKIMYDFGTNAPSAETNLKLNLNVGPIGNQTITGVIEFNPWLFADKDGNGMAAKPVEEDDPIPGAIRKAYLEAVGPYWTDGPAVTSRLGDLELAYSPFILATDAVNGMSISGIAYGPVEIGAFYGLDKGIRARGARVAAELGIADIAIDASVVKRGHEENEELDYAAYAIAKPIPGLAIDATYAAQTSTDSSAIRANAAAVVPYLPIDVVATAGYRRTGEAFNPTYRWTEEGNSVDGEGGIAAITAGLATSYGGFNVALDGEILGDDNDGKLDDERSIGATVGTTISWFDLSAGHKLTQEIGGEEPKVHNTTTLGVAMKEREVMPNILMSASYNASMPDFSLTNTRHIAKAAVGADVSVLKGIKVSGMYDSDPAESKPGRALGIEYGAPCGVNLGYSYDDLNTNMIHAGMEVEF